MEVRASRTASRSNITDDLTLANSFPGPNSFRITLQVCVGSLVGAIVAYADIFSVGSVSANTLDDAIAGRDHWGAPRRSEI